jgi:hypothetical protein
MIPEFIAIVSAGIFSPLKVILKPTAYARILIIVVFWYDTAFPFKAIDFRCKKTQFEKMEK